MATYTTLSEAINDLAKKGYTHDFNIKEDCIECTTLQLKLQPEEFEIDEKYRFEEMSDVDSESLLYAISSKDGKVKGLLVNAYGTYADYASFELVQKLDRPGKI